MTRIAIVQSAGNYTYDLVLKGVYGTTEPGQQQGQVVFVPAAEFAGVSHLFQQLPKVAVREQGVTYHDVPEQDADLAKAQMLFGLGARWSELYASRTSAAEGEVPQIGTALLAGERDAVARGVRTHLANLGMQVFAAPVLVQGEVHSHGQFLPNADALVGKMHRRAIVIDAAREPQPLGSTALSGARDAITQARPAPAADVEAAPDAAPAAAAPVVTQDEPQRVAAPRLGMGAWMSNLLGRPFGVGLGSDEDGDDDAAEVPQGGGHNAEQGAEQQAVVAAGPAWANFHGVDATVRATVYVVAPDAAAVPRALNFMLQAHQENLAKLHLDVQEVTEARDLQREDLALGFAEGDDFDEGYDRDRM